MGTFTVKQVAKMLCVDPETVRRWIRQGKLVAVQESRKDGNVISTEALDKFCRKYPKYAVNRENKEEQNYEIRFLDKTTYGITSKCFITLDELYNYTRSRPNLVIVDILPGTGL